VAVNLYTASAVKILLQNNNEVTLKQITDYPSDGKVEVLIEPEKETVFPVQLRIPKWAKNAKIMVNAEVQQSEIVAGTFYTIKRNWKRGDKITIDFPMNFRYVKGRKRNAGRIALMRGPIIYSLNLEKNPEATANGKRDYNDLRRILLDPSTLSEVKSDDSVRPGGTAVYISGWREENSGKADLKHEFKLKLTEFPDPGSQFIYFKIPDYSIQVEDELVEKNNDNHTIGMLQLQ
jgi:hypothetical protein